MGAVRKKQPRKKRARSSSRKTVSLTADEVLEFFGRMFTQIAYRKKLTVQDLQQCIIALVNLDPRQKELVRRCVALLRDRHSRVSKTLIRG